MLPEVFELGAGPALRSDPPWAFTPLSPLKGPRLILARLCSFIGKTSAAFDPFIPASQRV